MPETKSVAQNTQSYKEDVMIQLVQDFKIDDFINKLIDIITKIKSLHVIRRC